MGWRAAVIAMIYRPAKAGLIRIRMGHWVGGLRGRVPLGDHGTEASNVARRIEMEGFGSE